MSSKPNYFYRDKPIFGFDIGHGSLKVMELETTGKGMAIVGYGTTTFDIKAIDDGVLVDTGIVATAIRNLFKNDLKGRITTKRVAMAIPSYRTFSRAIQLPKLSEDELREAVQLEIEQYVPMPLEDLYLDYTTTSETADSREIFVVAVPKTIVDSYMALAANLSLEPVLIEPTMASCSRFFLQDKHNLSNVASVIIDFGSLTADISIFDKTVLATSTVPAGGLVFTEAIRDKLQVSIEEAGNLKTKYGLNVSNDQKKIVEALEPALSKLVTEIRRMLRYYEERYGAERKVGQIVMFGGGANMPGLSDYLTNALKVPVRTHNHPWATFEHKDAPPPDPANRQMFATVAGLSLLNPKEVFAHD